jgi:uncharacterized protein YndB with AHSA1/START domain
MNSSSIPPVTKTVQVPCPPQEAFRLFTGEMHEWWPLETHSISRNEAAFCGFEPKPGGRIFERSDSGVECTWGKVEVWNPPHRLVFSWHPGRDESTAQTVEILFVPDGSGTRVQLTHSGWERLSNQPAAVREEYDSGWNLVFVDRYAGHARSQHVLRISL